MLSLHNLSWTWPDGSVLFQNLNVDLNAGITALVGPNGSGKSTLMKLLAEHPSVAYLPQFLTPEPTQTVASLFGIETGMNAVYRIMDGSASESDYDLAVPNWSRLNQLLPFGKSWMDTASSMSGGEWMRLRLEAVKDKQPAILLMDEPTNHLDMQERAVFLNELSSLAECVLLISHDPQVLRCVDRIMELRDGKLTRFEGGYDAWMEWRDGQWKAAEADWEEARKQLEVAKSVARVSLQRQSKRQTRGAVRHRNRGVGKMALGIMKRSAEVSTAKLEDAHERKIEAAQRVVVEAAERRVGRVDLKLDVPSLGEVSSKRILIRIPEYPDCCIRFGERWHVEGPNGSGKTRLLNRMRESASVPIAFLDQHLSFLDPDLPIGDLLPKREHRLLLARIGWTAPDLKRTISTLSGGERMRLAMTCLLHSNQSPQILFLDEPTNHLDLDMREILMKTLSSFDGAIVFASHDTDFVNAMRPDHVISL